MRPRPTPLAALLVALHAAPAWAQASAADEPIELRPSPALRPAPRGEASRKLPIILRADTLTAYRTRYGWRLRGGFWNWVDREEATGPSDCAGTYLAGGDLWMLHAWVVRGYDNRDGRFATFNPKLCPPDAGTPDLLRCPD